MPNASKPFIRNINLNAKQRKHQIGQQYFPRKVVPRWRRGNPLQFLPLTRTPGWRVGRGDRFRTRRVVPRDVMLRLLSIPRIRELNRPGPPPTTPPSPSATPVFPFAPDVFQIRAPGRRVGRLTASSRAHSSRVGRRWRRVVTCRVDGIIDRRGPSVYITLLGRD